MASVWNGVRIEAPDSFSAAHGLSIQPRCYSNKAMKGGFNREKLSKDNSGRSFTQLKKKKEKSPSPTWVYISGSRLFWYKVNVYEKVTTQCNSNENW